MRADIYSSSRDDTWRHHTALVCLPCIFPDAVQFEYQWVWTWAPHWPPVGQRWGLQASRPWLDLSLPLSQMQCFSNTLNHPSCFQFRLFFIILTVRIPVSQTQVHITINTIYFHYCSGFFFSNVMAVPAPAEGIQFIFHYQGSLYFFPFRPLQKFSFPDTSNSSDCQLLIGLKLRWVSVGS